MSLSIETMRMPVAPLGPDSVLPSIFTQMNIQTEKRLEVDEDDEIFFDVGRIENILPYQMKSLYTRRRQAEDVRTAVLENDALRAVFLPDYGGKLWSLYDKKAGRELLYVNDCLQPANLALLDAWMSGGVEWNMGLIGHSPFTCARMSMAEAPWPGGATALRFYAYERLREAVYQMDFALPENSPVLLCRMRIRNLLKSTIPMYWYSNIAVPKRPGARVIVPSSSAYFSDKNRISKCSVPIGPKGLDITYAENSPESVDYFFRLADCDRKFIAYADHSGSGMFQTSTARMKGRKLFVWGEGEGGRSWQRWLTGSAGEYVEIQAGVNRTQYECIPMPPGAAWEWMEVYGPLDMAAEDAHGDYTLAAKTAESAIQKQISGEYLEELLIKSKASAKTRGRVIMYGEDAPWAALERARREADGEEAFEKHLDFGPMGKAQEPWLSLLEGGGFPAPKPEQMGYLVSLEWEKRLKAETMENNWYAQYHLGLVCLFRGDKAGCEKHLEEALKLHDAPLAHYALGVCLYLRRDAGAIGQLRLATPELKSYLEFNREHLKILCALDAYGEALSTARALPGDMRMDGHVRYFEALALSRQGELEEAEGILMQENTYQMPGMREGPEPLSDLWFYIKEQQAIQAGRPFDKTTAKVPKALDYRMNIQAK
ncbi:MAG: DUF5107 domain-containing protein [Eubacteriales bacterium]|nr:DUF5107 domain-containing protein [Eubacteriales bacterium]